MLHICFILRSHPCRHQKLLEQLPLKLIFITILPQVGRRLSPSTDIRPLSAPGIITPVVSNTQFINVRIAALLPQHWYSRQLSRPCSQAC